MINKKDQKKRKAEKQRIEKFIEFLDKSEKQYYKEHSLKKDIKTQKALIIANLITKDEIPYEEGDRLFEMLLLEENIGKIRNEIRRRSLEGSVWIADSKDEMKIILNNDSERTKRKRRDGEFYCELSKNDNYLVFFHKHW